MRAIFQEQHKTGCIDLEAVEMALRSALHRAGASALSRLLQWSPPAADERTLPCPCGHHAGYKELRAKSILTVVGLATVKRPYYLCDHCGEGQFPVDQELDVAEVEVSPGVRRMMAVVSSESAFEQGRQHLELLADLKVTTKAVERQAEQIGADIAAREQAEIQQSQQLQLPLPIGPPIPILYVQMDATGVP
ncbi:MAG: ISKra4-like element ISDesp4 family transposase, partial [Burkholderiales bacterium]